MKVYHLLLRQKILPHSFTVNYHQPELLEAFLGKCVKFLASVKEHEKGSETWVNP